MIGKCSTLSRYYHVLAMILASLLMYGIVVIMVIIGVAKSYYTVVIYTNPSCNHYQYHPFNNHHITINRSIITICSSYFPVNTM